MDDEEDRNSESVHFSDSEVKTILTRLKIYFYVGLAS